MYPFDPDMDHSTQEAVENGLAKIGFMLANGYYGQSKARRRPTAISSKDGIVLVNVTCSRVTRSRSFLTSVFAQLERNRVVPDLVTTSQRNVSLAIQASNDLGVGEKLVSDLREFGTVGFFFFFFFLGKNSSTSVAHF